MKFASFDAFDISLWKVTAIGVASAALGAGALSFATGDALGGAKGATLLLVAVLVFYIVVSAPRRWVDSQRASQARESLLLSASALACLTVTGSRSKTLLLLRPKDPALAHAVAESARRVLLGARVDTAVAAAAQGLASYSAATSLKGVASMKPREFEGGDEESRGLVASSELNMETKLPVFMTVCFFAPIMIILYAVFSHTYGPEGLAELGVFEFAIVDLVYYLSSGDRGPR